MNKELYELYIEGLAKGWIDPKNAELSEVYSEFSQRVFEYENPAFNDIDAFNSEEFQQALQVYNSKLQKVLE